MNSDIQFLIALGAILLLGMATDYLGRHTPLPRVTLLLLFGILVGPSVLDWIPYFFVSRFELIAEVALLLVGFLLGGSLTVDSFRQSGRQVVVISLVAAIFTTLLVSLGLIFIGMDPALAILLGCIAAATAPAAIVELVMSDGQGSSFSSKLLAVVALDDAWGLILFSLGIAFAAAMNGMGGEGSLFTTALYEIGIALLLGIGLGLPAAYLTGRIKAGQPMLSEALGVVFLCGGLALWLEVSFLLATMAMGAVIANLATHHERPFHEIEGVESPVMALFFVVAGASLEIEMMTSIGVIAAVYIVLRATGKITGAWLGGLMSKADTSTRRWMGVAMLPQAGAAMGMALVAAHYFPQHQQVLLSTVITVTIIFELVGPLFTRMALRRVSR